MQILPPINLQDKHVTDTEEDYLDRIRYLRLHNRNDLESMKQLVNVPVDDRTLQQEFFLRMYLKCDIPYFSEYDRHTLDNLTKVMR